MPNKNSSLSIVQQLSLLLKGVKTKSLVALFLIIFQGITEGVGLLFIIPLLAIAGVEGSTSSSNSMVQSIQGIFEANGLALSVSNVLIIYVLIMSFYALLRYFQRLNTAAITQRVVIHWRIQFFKQLSHATWASIQSIKSSDLQDTLAIEIRKFGSISNQLIQFIATLVLMLVYLIVSFFISYKLSLIALFPISLMVLLNKPINRKTYSLGQSSVGFNKRMQEIVLEHLLALKLVKSFNQEDAHVREFEKVNYEVEDQVISFAKATQKTRTLFEILAAFVIAGYIFTAIVLFETPLAELLLLIFIFARLLPKTTNLVSNYQHILNSLPSLEWTIDLLGKLKTEPQVDTKSQQFRTIAKAIEFKKVCFGYDKKKVLEHLSFTIPANQTTVITGASGAGKSTTIDLIMALYRAEKGEILLDGTPLNEINALDWKSNISYIAQEPFLFNETISYNLKWANKNATEAAIWKALEQAGAKDFISQLPDRLNTIVGERGSQLSGGERQRIALARALVRQPQLLILDEATSAVDDKSEELIKQALAQLAGTMTIIIVAHRSKLIDLADEIIQL